MRIDNKNQCSQCLRRVYADTASLWVYYTHGHSLRGPRETSNYYWLCPVCFLSEKEMHSIVNTKYVSRYEIKHLPTIREYISKCELPSNGGTL